MKGLGAELYNTDWTVIDATWETCTLRKWLNNDFLNAAFTAEEQDRLAETRVSADKNPWYYTDPGNDTQDRVWLPSIKEVMKYFKDDASRICKPTRSAVKYGAYENAKTGCWWWLRTPGSSAMSAAYVGDDGSVRSIGYKVKTDPARFAP